MNTISIIIPALNEAKNIGRLIEQINDILTHSNILYEIIVVDDNSEDNTRALVKHLSGNLPVKLFIKEGNVGKEQSLLEGISNSQYETICIIDADYQYSPDVIPQMLEKIVQGSDIVVANRKFIDIPKVTKLLNKTIQYLFIKYLHGLDIDVQSGLKVFKKEIIERLIVNPSEWTFDVEFLKKSIEAGYEIDFVTVSYTKRIYGITNTNKVSTYFDICKRTIRLKLQASTEILFHPKIREQKGFGFHYKKKEYIQHTFLHPRDTAFYRISVKQKTTIILLLTVVMLGVYVNWYVTIVTIFGLLITLYFTDLLFNLLLIIKSFSNPKEISVTNKEMYAIPEKDWPTYSIFCPLYKEWSVISQFVSAIHNLDYPKDKLQVLLLLESDDLETINAIKQVELPEYFSILIVPNSYPKTKPKACNFGLTKATGEYSVIFDAEDIPDPKQLKKAVIAFSKSDPKVICLQAKLNFYNVTQNILTRLFTAEYSLWFNLILPGLQSIHAPIPLGGTSNHFKTNALRAMNGWDSFNVTEDADLGMRLVKKGFKTAIFDSQTLEEANSNVKNWFNQRSRWIKGYMQTYFVQMKHLYSFPKKHRMYTILCLQMIIGGKVISLFINPIMWIITILYFIFRSETGNFISSLFPAPILYIGFISLVVGNFLYLFYYMIGSMKHKQYEIIEYVFLVPFYWLAMSIASWIALLQFIKAPFFWAKTKHGLHIKNNTVINNTLEYEAEESYGNEFPYGQAAFIIYE